jgi:hypothetical protein
VYQADGSAPEGNPMQDVNEFLAEENNVLVAKQQHIQCQGGNEEKANAECNTIGHGRPKKKAKRPVRYA